MDGSLSVSTGGVFDSGSVSRGQRLFRELPSPAPLDAASSVSTEPVNQPAADDDGNVDDEPGDFPPQMARDVEQHLKREARRPTILIFVLVIVAAAIWLYFVLR
jgi:hypothetical protein